MFRKLWAGQRFHNLTWTPVGGRETWRLSHPQNQENWPSLWVGWGVGVRGGGWFLGARLQEGLLEKEWQSGVGPLKMG